MAEAHTESDLPLVELYTDGACSGNPGPGGWAYLLRHRVSGAEREDSGGDPATTNNRMELQAVIEGLGALSRRSSVDLYSDSQYVLNGLKEWMAGWKKRGWKTADMFEPNRSFALHTKVATVLPRQVVYHATHC